MAKRNLELEQRDYAYIGIDFDNTVVSDLYPEVGLSLGAEETLQELVKKGHKLIFFSVRSGISLDKAINWFKDHSIELFGINENPDFDGDEKARKVYCDLYIDDRNIGTPVAAFYDSLRDRVLRVVDWSLLREELKKLNLI